MATDHAAPPEQLKENYRRVQERIAAAAARSGRRAEDVLMVAVTKHATPDQIRTLVEMGHVDLGENRVQQLQQRAPQLQEFLTRRKAMAGAATKALDDLPDQVRWHMIGHLQRNKVKQVAQTVALIHSVDSLRLAEELHTYAARTDTTLDILLQVNTSGEASKQGVAAPAVIHMCEQIDTMMHLRLRGLMTMAPLCEDPEDARPTFSRTADLFEDVRKEKIGGGNFNVLSMGMSNDFEVAIEEGANLVRIGSALFDAAEA